MCGISALFSRGGLRDPASTIRKMTQLIRHRGPDDEGYALFNCSSKHIAILGGPDTPAEAFKAPLPYAPKQAEPALEKQATHVAFGHRRLSIVDLSPHGHQPMCTTDQRYWIVYNGEVYNYPELRKELEAAGVEFHSHSDTEVILRAYEHWGKACLSRFNGMFAFVIFDRLKDSIFIARDRFGVKPLYYWVSAQQGFVAFASEIKQFTSLPGWQATAAGQGVYDFLNWGVTDHTADTLFVGVKQLRGGEYIEGPVSSLFPSPNVQRWYELKTVPFAGTFEEASHQFYSIFEDAVRLRLRADVPVGSCLSGGLDSSSIVCIANELLRKENSGVAWQKTFSACSTVKRFDERQHVDIVVKATGVDAHYTYPTLDGLFENLKALTWTQDEPFGSTSIYAQWAVFELARKQNIKVMLDGQGADEQLAGYHPFFRARFGDLLSSLQWMKLFKESQATKRHHGTRKALVHAVGQMLPRFIADPIRGFLGKGLAHPEWMDWKGLGVKTSNPHTREVFQGSKVHQMSQTQLTGTSVPMLLHWEDRDSMAHSVESRVPFLDYRLVEFVLGLPDAYKISDGVTKRVLREGMKNKLPEPIRMRMDKMGFVTPEEVWVRENRHLFEKAVHTAVERSEGMLKNSVKDKVERIISGREPFNFFIWRLVSFGTWLEEFSVGVKAGIK